MTHRVAIVGAGQVGTMLGIALRRGFPDARILLHDRDPDLARRALELGAGDGILDPLSDALAADAVVLAVPVPEIVALLARTGHRVAAGTLVLDTGSAKARVVRAMREHLSPDVHAIGGHPIAGTQRPGPDGAAPSALSGAIFALTPVRDDPEAERRARALVEAAGAVPLVLDPDAHDAALARTSHLPHLLAAAVALAAEGTDRRLAGSGFAGAVRLAASDPEMVAGFLGANADEVRAAGRELVAALEELLATVDHPERLSVLLGKARSAAEEAP